MQWPQAPARLGGKGDTLTIFAESLKGGSWDGVAPVSLNDCRRMHDFS